MGLRFGTYNLLIANRSIVCDDTASWRAFAERGALPAFQTFDLRQLRNGFAENLRPASLRWGQPLLLRQAFENC
jgi:hypothetical protein